MDHFERLEAKASAGQALTREEALTVLASSDLVSLGMLGETARRARAGNRVTYGRVATVGDPGATADGNPGEVRLDAGAATAAEARAAVRRAHGLVSGQPLTGFSLNELLTIARGDLQALGDLARALHDDGLTAVSDVRLDEFSSTAEAIAAVQAVTSAGLGAWRATIWRADADARLDLIDRAMDVQRATGVLRAFAPLPRLEASEAPSTGYDDVRTVAIARLRAVDIPSIQVDWPLHGPKLAQVAITFGANDIDGVGALDVEQLGRRRAPKEDIERQIRAAAAVPAERDGRYELRP